MGREKVAQKFTHKDLLISAVWCQGTIFIVHPKPPLLRPHQDQELRQERDTRDPSDIYGGIDRILRLTGRGFTEHEKRRRKSNRTIEAPIVRPTWDGKEENLKAKIDISPLFLLARLRSAVGAAWKCIEMSTDRKSVV